MRLACARHELRLPDGARAGFFLGDGEAPHMGRLKPGSLNCNFCRRLCFPCQAELHMGTNTSACQIATCLLYAMGKTASAVLFLRVVEHMCVVLHSYWPSSLLPCGCKLYHLRSNRQLCLFDFGKLIPFTPNPCLVLDPNTYCMVLQALVWGRAGRLLPPSSTTSAGTRPR